MLPGLPPAVGLGHGPALLRGAFLRLPDLRRLVSRDAPLRTIQRLAEFVLRPTLLLQLPGDRLGRGGNSKAKQAERRKDRNRARHELPPLRFDVRPRPHGYDAPAEIVYTGAGKGRDEDYFGIVRRDGVMIMLKSITPEIHPQPNHSRQNGRVGTRTSMLPTRTRYMKSNVGRAVPVHRQLSDTSVSLRAFEVLDNSGSPLPHPYVLLTTSLCSRG